MGADIFRRALDDEEAVRRVLTLFCRSGIDSTDDSDETEKNLLNDHFRAIERSSDVVRARENNLTFNMQNDRYCRMRHPAVGRILQSKGRPDPVQILYLAGDDSGLVCGRHHLTCGLVNSSMATHYSMYDITRLLPNLGRGVRFLLFIELNKRSGL